MKSTKKVLAILSVVALLATCAVTVIAGNVSDNPRPTAAFVDMTTETPKGGTIVPNGNGRTSTTWDETQQAWKIDNNNVANAHSIQPLITFSNKHVPYNDGNTVINGYVVALMKMTNYAYPGIGGVNHDASMGNSNNTTEVYNAPLATTTYQPTTDWQLVVWDCTELLNTTDGWTPAGEDEPLEWAGLRLELWQWNKGATANDIFWMKWCGIFSSVEDAYAYAGMEMPAEKKANPSGAFIDYSVATPTGVSGYVSASAMNAARTLSYDAAEMATKVTPVEGNVSSNSYYLTSKLTSPYQTVDGKYTYAAALVKLGDTSLASYTPRFEGYFNSGATKVNGTTVKALEATTDWQLVIAKWDPANATLSASGAYWNYLFLHLTGGSAPSVGASFHIKWAGVFDSIPAIYNYADMAIPDELVPTTAGKLFNFVGNSTATATDGQSQTIENGTYTADDGTIGGLKVMPNATDKKPTCNLQISYSQRPAFSTNKVVAAYVKPLTEAAASATYTFRVYTNSPSFGASAYAPYKSYDTTADGYQLIYWDTTTEAASSVTGTGLTANTTNVFTNASASSVCPSIHILLHGSTMATSLEDGYIVKWAGFFPSVEAAQQQIALDEAVAANKAAQAEKAADKAAADSMKAAITALGTITPASDAAAIAAARAQYAALTDAQKMKVGNAALAAAEDTYDSYRPNLTGVALRVTDQKGIRFTAKVTKADVDALAGYTLSGVGFVFCKAENHASGELKFDAGEYAKTTERTFNDAEAAALAAGTTLTYYASVVNIPEESAEVDLMGRSYLIYTNGEETVRVYSDETNDEAGSYAQIRDLQEVRDFFAAQ